MKHRKAARAAAGILCLGFLMQSAGILPVSAETRDISINEVCSKNTVYAAPDGNFYDWIELYNSGSSAVSLAGWGLTDDTAEPMKYTFPDGVSIEAGSRLVVFCDKTAGKTDPNVVSFGLSGTGETLTLTSADKTFSTTVTFGAISADTSYGQYPDGSGEYFNMTGTPGKENAAPEGSAAVKLPVFSQDSGFYDAGTTVSIDVPAGTTVYYTTDGSDPTTSSQKYAEPFTLSDVSSNPNKLSAETQISTSGYTPPSQPVDKANIIRAIAVDAQGRESECVTRTYFVGKTNSGYYPNMKVVSLVTDPENLFNYDTGIYVLGKHYDEDNGSSGGDEPGFPGIPGWGGGGWGGGFGFQMPWEMEANYTQKGKEWERQAVMTVFDKGDKVVDQTVGIRIKGAATRHNAQKSFNIYAREEYGLSELAFDFFDGTCVKAKNGKAIKKFENISLRNGGNDNGYAFFRDSINQKLTEDRSFAHQAMSECIVFIDGEFWGIYQITEKLNDTYISDHYGVAKADVAMVKSGDLEEGTDADLADWNALMEGIANGSVTYKQACEKLDMQGFMDYFAAQIYWSNDDWPQKNYAAWRSNTVDAENPYADGKWRMILFDTESGLGLYGSDTKSVNSNPFNRIAQNNDEENGLGKAFTKLMKDDEFRLAFARTMMDLENYNFDPDRAEEVISYYKETYREQLSDTLTRFGSRNQIDNEYRTISEFYQRRANSLNGSLKNAAGLTTELHTITVENDKTGGEISLNTLQLGTVDKWSGKYHSDYDVTVTASPVPGRSFSHWEIDGAELTDGTKQSASISLSLTGDATVKAVYSGLTPGDYNGDGTVNAQDVAVLQKYLLGEKVTIVHAEMIADGTTDVFDLAALKKKLDS